MTLTLRPSAVARSACRLGLLLGVVACRAHAPVKAVPGSSSLGSVPPDTAPTPTIVASTAPPATNNPSGAAGAAVPHPVDPHGPHPVLLALVRRLGEWSPELASRLTTISLADTAAADSERTRDYLLHLVAHRLLLPTLRLSADPVLGDVGESIAGSSLFALYSVSSQLSIYADLTPRACSECQLPDCSVDDRCTLELKRLAPAFFVEYGLGFFDGLCEGEHDFPWPPSCELALERYLDATVTAGLSRRRVEEVSFQIVTDVARRCRTIEQPLALDSDHPPEPAQVIEQAHARWRALYGTSLGGDPLVVVGAVRSTASSADAEAVVRRFECRMYREVPTTRGYARALEAYYAAEVASQESADEPIDSPLLECDERSGDAARWCNQVDSGVSGVRSVLGEKLESTPLPDGLVTQLALALESLSLAGIPPRVLDNQLRLLARQLTASEPGHRSSEHR